MISTFQDLDPRSKRVRFDLHQWVIVKDSRLGRIHSWIYGQTYHDRIYMVQFGPGGPFARYSSEDLRAATQAEINYGEGI